MESAVQTEYHSRLSKKRTLTFLYYFGLSFSNPVKT